MNRKRNTLKKIVGVSTVVALAPTSWTKPLVNSVVLPVHAQTSNLVISVRRAMTPSFGMAMEFNFDEQKGNVSRISTTVIQSPSGSGQAQSKTDLTIRAAYSQIKGLNVLDISIYSNYSQTYTVINPPTNLIGDVRSTVYDDFISTSGQAYAVRIEALFRASDNTAVITVGLQPR